MPTLESLQHTAMHRNNAVCGKVYETRWIIKLLDDNWSWNFSVLCVDFMSVSFKNIGWNICIYQRYHLALNVTFKDQNEQTSILWRAISPYAHKRINNLTWQIHGNVSLNLHRKGWFMNFRFFLLYPCSTGKCYCSVAFDRNRQIKENISNLHNLLHTC